MVRRHRGFSWEIGCPLGVVGRHDKHGVFVAAKTITGLGNAQMGDHVMWRDPEISWTARAMGLPVGW